MTLSTPSTALDNDAQTYSNQEGARIVGAQTQADSTGPGPNLLSADTLVGNTVFNNKNEVLGEVISIMLDVERGKIAYAVLSVGGWLNMIGNRLFAIPWNVLKLDTDRKAFILNIDKEILKNAPGFDKDNWPKMAEVQWANKIHSHYNTPPYWTIY